MKIRVVSDGTHTGTTVCDAETGEPIENVTQIEWGIMAEGEATVTLTVIRSPVDLIGERKGG